MNNKKGFTLIELLAVIIILGILLIIAVPSVTKYISDSRKSTYIQTAKEVIGGVRTLVNNGKLEMFDSDATYYMDIKCVPTENALKSPYGEFDKAYVIVTYNGSGYDYYWVSVDETGQGIKNITKYDDLDSELIESDLKIEDFDELKGIDGRKKIIVIDKTNNCAKGEATTANTVIDISTGEEIVPVCKRAKTLHTATCGGGACTAFNISHGTSMTFGHIGNAGSLSAGDAFDCDVNDDGIFDAATERFYYLGSNGENAILIYYKNITGQTTVAYSTNNSNRNGPTKAATYLPTSSTWKNEKIVSPGTKTIKNDKSENVVNFNYSAYVARLPEYQDISGVCNATYNNYGGLKNCSFLVEETIFVDASSYPTKGFWLGTMAKNNSTVAYGAHAGGMIIEAGGNYGVVNSSANYGVKPVIEVKKSDMNY